MKFNLKKKLEAKHKEKIWKAFLKDLENIEKNVEHGKFTVLDLNVLDGHISVFKNSIEFLKKEFENNPKQREKEVKAFNELVETTQLLRDNLKQRIINEKTKKAFSWLKQTYQECIAIVRKN